MDLPLNHQNTMKFTPEMQDKVIRTLSARIANKGIKPKSRKALDEEYTFLCGAMVAIDAMFPSPDASKLSGLVPPIWAINPMCGRSVFDE